MKINIGIADQDRQTIARGLSVLLADSYTLNLKLHNYHWNVRGRMFQTLHDLFEAHYTELSGAIDLVAERIRTLGVTAPASYASFTELTSIKDGTGEENAKEMIRILLEDNEAVVRTARRIFPDVEKAQDEASVDILTQRMQVHEKNAWILRSLLED
jgi:starvation-inducible DNA-binding protein